MCEIRVLLTALHGAGLHAAELARLFRETDKWKHIITRPPVLNATRIRIYMRVLTSTRMAFMTLIFKYWMPTELASSCQLFNSTCKVKGCARIGYGMTFSCSTFRPELHSICRHLHFSFSFYLYLVLNYN